jgi:peptide/nickel transport system permease protein
VVLIVSGIPLDLHPLMPGGAPRAFPAPRAPPAQIQQFNHANGLDRPLVVQFGIWLGHLVHGNLGYSYHLNQSVTSLIAQKLPKTIVLNALALLFSVVIAIPIGVRQAVRRNSAFDYTATLVGFIFYSTPVFFLSLMLVLWFSLGLHWLPAQAPQGSTHSGILSQPTGLVLPVASLVLLQVSLFTRYLRSAVMDNLVQDYVRTAYAKGAGPRRVVYLHVLRNSLIPMVTLLGFALPGILAGSLVTEQVFNYPGMGLLFYQEAQASDYPVLLGIVLISGVAIVVGNLLADIGYAVLDPRVRYS